MLRTFPVLRSGWRRSSKVAAGVDGVCHQCFVCIFMPDLFGVPVVLSKNGKCENAWSAPSIVNDERVNVAKKSHASAYSLATAQQRILQRTFVAISIGVANLSVRV